MPLQGGVRGILLDLDDTLYEEREYFRSGLFAVAQWLSEQDNSVDYFTCLQADVDRNGRQGVLDRIQVPSVLQVEFSECWRKTLLQIYRNHTPSLSLFNDVDDFIKLCRINNCRLGLVTDGKSCVQWRKYWALGLHTLLDVAVVTDDIDAPKPSIIPFQVAAQRLGLAIHECMYIADDASKDFLAPRSLGMATIHLQRYLDWPLARSAPVPEANAHYMVHSLHEAGILMFGGTE